MCNIATTTVSGCTVELDEKQAAALMSQRKKSLSAGWKFHLGKVTDAEKEGFDDTGWKELSLPHDWSIALPFDEQCPGGQQAGYLNGGTGWYRKEFTLPEDLAGKRISVLFDGAYMNSTVWFNGRKLGTHHYGYTPFSFDVTRLWNNLGSNLLGVKVDHKQPTSRWYSGSGVNRNVWLVVTDPLHIPLYGIYVTTPRLGEQALAEIETTVRNDGVGVKDALLCSTVLDADGNIVARASSNVAVASGDETLYHQQLYVINAHLWSPEQPYLYRLRSVVTVGGIVRDICETPFGFRSVRIDPNQGFFLNDTPVKLRGVCLHSDDCGCLGQIASPGSIRRKLEMLKEMGCNAIRTAHNPPSPEFMEACDRMGFLVMDEAFDCWQMEKNKNGYHLYFERDAKSDIQTMVLRDKNHPCVVLWSIGNEVPDSVTPEGVTIARNLREWIREIDTTRPVTIADNNANDKVADPYVQQIADVLDAFGFNYAEQIYDSEHAAHPNRCLFGSEITSAVRSRGVYKLPIEEYIPATPDHQCSSYDNCIVPWGSRAESALIFERSRPYLLGSFIWTGFDYLGEPEPYAWPSKSSYFGIIDTAGIPKDVYYFYKSQWNPEPMVHMFPAWQGRPGQVIPVMVYTNATSVELFLNGRSLGVQHYDPNGDPLHLLWCVAYEPGRLQAVARDVQGHVVATAESGTPGKAAKIKLATEKKQLLADGGSLVFIVASVEDAEGNPVPNAADMIVFHAEGGQILGVDNGDATDHSPYKAQAKKAFHGKCLVVVQNDGRAGSLTVSAHSDTLPNGSARVTIEKQDAPAK